MCHELLFALINQWKFNDKTKEVCEFKNLSILKSNKCHITCEDKYMWCIFTCYNEKNVEEEIKGKIDLNGDED